ncbi:unnamed protein product [Polarella glacialis]|uniref:Uncharacterized protein n=1 Tax=Polarella glacialis TaxID=89957 RepID=A0A813KYS1_POLGL|nr:unnamed protein product [Polarella glacialis]
MDPAAAGALLSALESPQRDERLQALDQLRSLSADPSGCLDRRRLASAICACLSEESVEVCCRCATVAPEVLEWLQKDRSEMKPLSLSPLLALAFCNSHERAWER